MLLVRNDVGGRRMNAEYFAVYCDNIKLADDMTLATALLFIKAYVQECCRDTFTMSLRKVSKEVDDGSN